MLGVPTQLSAAGMGVPPSTPHPCQVSFVMFIRPPGIRPVLDAAHGNPSQNISIVRLTEACAWQSFQTC